MMDKITIDTKSDDNFYIIHEHYTYIFNYGKEPKITQEEREMFRISKKANTLDKVKEYFTSAEVEII